MSETIEQRARRVLGTDETGDELRQMARHLDLVGDRDGFASRLLEIADEIEAGPEHVWAVTFGEGISNEDARASATVSRPVVRSSRVTVGVFAHEDAALRAAMMKRAGIAPSPEWSSFHFGDGEDRRWTGPGGQVVGVRRHTVEREATARTWGELPVAVKARTLDALAGVSFAHLPPGVQLGVALALDALREEPNIHASAHTSGTTDPIVLETPPTEEEVAELMHQLMAEWPASAYRPRKAADLVLDSLNMASHGAMTDLFRELRTFVHSASARDQLQQIEDAVHAYMRGRR